MSEAASSYLFQLLPIVWQDFGTFGKILNHNGFGIVWPILLLVQTIICNAVLKQNLNHEINFEIVMSVS